METKLFEIRDAGTFIPVLAIKLTSTNEQERYLLGRSGYGRTKEEHETYIAVCRISGDRGTFTTDPYEQGGGRTMQFAHSYIRNHWDELISGEVIDCEFLNGETPESKVSEAHG